MSIVWCSIIRSCLAYTLLSISPNIFLSFVTKLSGFIIFFISLFSSLPIWILVTKSSIKS